MSSRSRALTGALLLMIAFSAVPPAVANAEPPGPNGGQPVGDLSPALAQALKRDLNLTDTDLRRRLATEAAAPVVEKAARAAAGTSFAGAWLDADARQVSVAVTDPATADAVRQAGGQPVVVKRSEADLDAVRTKLDTTPAPADVYGWYVDVASNSVVVSAATEAAGRAFANGSDVRVVTTDEAPKPLYDTRGGDQYVINGNTLCSIGFAVAGGFVTAGHCGGTGSPTLGYNNVAQGTFAGSSFPGNDYSWIRTNGNWTSQPWVNNYAGGNVIVSGSQDAAIGSSICRSGRTTGWRCGTLLGRNETINYAQGAVSGLSRSNACAQPGDSGGSWISGNQAQGVTSGGSGDCTSGGTMWF